MRLKCRKWEEFEDKMQKTGKNLRIKCREFEDKNAENGNRFWPGGRFEKVRVAASDHVAALV